MQRFNITCQLSQADLAAISHLYAACDNISCRLDLTELQDIKAQARFLICVTDRQESEVIAFAWVKQVEQVALIMDPIVHPEYRQFGIGQMLLRHILTHPKLEGAQTIELAKNVDESQIFSQWRLPWMQQTNSADADKQPASASALSLQQLLMNQF